MDNSPLKIIADNDLILSELKKLFEEEFSTPDIELGFSNERLGERVRARLQSKEIIERVFSKILSFRTPSSKGEIKNPAR